MAAESPHLFISYRREDTQWIARALYRHLSEGFGAHRVFMDRVEIRGGDQWRRKIDEALQRSTVVLAIVGRQWLTLTDDYRRLRIDRDDDWVRTEIRFALNHKKRLIPLYVDGATPITDTRHLPTDIRTMIDSQGITLAETYWDAGLYELVRQLRANGFQSHRSTIAMPERRKRVEPLTAGLLDKELDTLLGWGVTTSFVSMGAGDTPVPRTELYKEYTFNSFTEATAFMATPAPLLMRAITIRAGRTYGPQCACGCRHGTLSSSRHTMMFASPTRLMTPSLHSVRAFARTRSESWPV